MRNSIQRAVAASLAASLGLATVSTGEAAVRPGGGFHGGGFRGWHGGGWGGGGWGGGGWGPAIGAGIVGGPILGSLASPYAYGGYDGCYQYQPMYSPAGVFLGNQLVNVCY